MPTTIYEALVVMFALDPKQHDHHVRRLLEVGGWSATMGGCVGRGGA